jgi:hypothetical protein
MLPCPAPLLLLLLLLRPAYLERACGWEGLAQLGASRAAVQSAGRHQHSPHRLVDKLALAGVGHPAGHCSERVGAV